MSKLDDLKMQINKINSKSRLWPERTFARIHRSNLSNTQIRPSKKLVAIVTFCLVILIKTLVANAEVASSRLPELKQQIRAGGALKFTLRDSRQLNQRDQNGFQLHELYSMGLEEQHRAAALSNGSQSTPAAPSTSATTRNLIETSSMSPSLFNLASQLRQMTGSTNQPNGSGSNAFECPNGLLTFELSTGFIYKPSGQDETLSMMPTLQLTDCLEHCLHNASCLAINFEMGLCVLLASSAKQNQQNLFASQFPVFTIYAEKKCLLTDPDQAKQRRRCQRAWTFERVAGYEMKTKPRLRLKLATKELCMEACLMEREFACRSANWHRQTGECQLHDQDRHSVSQSEAGDQRIKASLSSFYGPHATNSTGSNGERQQSPASHQKQQYFNPFGALVDRSRLIGQLEPSNKLAVATANSGNTQPKQQTAFKQLFHSKAPPSAPVAAERSGRQSAMKAADWPASMQQHYIDLPVDIQVDYLENNCIYEPNKLCEFRKIQNRILKTVDSIYQDVGSLEECRQKCLNAPYRCYSFDYGDTSERVCRTSHLDQASLMSVSEPYLEVAGAVTYELAACFNVTIQCRARGMVAQVSSSKSFNGKIYAKSRPASCMEDVSNSLQFELHMKYHDNACDVRATSNQHQGVFSNDIIIQHHDSIVTTQDVGLSVYCQYDLGNRSVTNNVDLAIERLPEGPMESKQQQSAGGAPAANGGVSGPSSGPLTITSLATTVVKSPNVTMRITNMNGQPVASATVGDRLALLFEIKEKTSPFGILVREIVAMDGRQLDIVNGSSQQLNSSQLYQQQSAPAAELQAQQPANSVQFLDPDGCPTDARLMGPLVRMDPHGHRLLAPFDAFKFPSSEMVFFRAVVSSCVSDCKPAVCSGGGDLSGPLGQPELAPPSYGDLFSPTPSDDVVATTRNMQTSSTATTSASGSTTSELQQVSSASSTARPLAISGVSTVATTTTSGTEAPSREQQASFASTFAPSETARTTKLHNQQTDFTPSDLLTTVPGFVVHQSAVSQQEAELAQSQPATTVSSALVNSNKLQTNGNDTNGPGADQSSERISMTNNHNLGRPSPRPMTTTTIGDDNNQTNYTDHGHNSLAGYQQQEAATSGQAGDRWPVLPPPVKYEPLTSDEQRAIEQLLDGYETSKQLFSSTSAPGSTQQSSLSQVVGVEKTLRSGLAKLLPIYQATWLPSGARLSSSCAQLDDSEQAMTSREVLDKIKALIADCDPYHKPDENGYIGRQLPDIADQVRPSRRDYSLATSLMSLLSIEMIFDKARVEVRQEPDFDEKKEFASERISLKDLIGRDRSLHSRADLQSRKFPQMRLFPYLKYSDLMGELGDATFAQAADKIPYSVAQEIARHKSIREERDNASSGSQRWRSKRDIAEDELNISSGYVYMRQPQQTTNLSQPNKLEFTHGHVEMYRTNQLHRIKRQVPAFEEFEAHPRPRDQHREEPKYELEEMVVQSIKIVDRIHFEDEQLREQQSRDQRAAVRRKGILRKSDEVGDLPQANRQLRDGDSLIEVDKGPPDYGQEPLRSRLSAINILLVAMCFVFIQISMVLLCLINWNRQRGRQNRSLFPDLASFKTVDSSTISSSMTYSNCSNYR